MKIADKKSYTITSATGKNPTITQFTDEKTGLIGFKNENGRILIKPQYQGAYDFNTHGITDVFDKVWYKINTSGERLVNPYFFDNGPDYYVSELSRFEDNKKLGFVDLKGEIVIPAQFDWVSPYLLFGACFNSLQWL